MAIRERPPWWLSKSVLPGGYQRAPSRWLSESALPGGYQRAPSMVAIRERPPWWLSESALPGGYPVEGVSPGVAVVPPGELLGLRPGRLAVQDGVGHGHVALPALGQGGVRPGVRLTWA